MALEDISSEIYSTLASQEWIDLRRLFSAWTKSQCRHDFGFCPPPACRAGISDFGLTNKAISKHWRCKAKTCKLYFEVFVQTLGNNWYKKIISPLNNHICLFISFHVPNKDICIDNHFRACLFLKGDIRAERALLFYSNGKNPALWARSEFFGYAWKYNTGAWSIGELSKIPLSAGEYWNKNRRLWYFSVLLLALLHYSITALFQKHWNNRHHKSPLGINQSPVLWAWILYSTMIP